MKILLVGEFSGVHNELWRALTQKGYDVTRVSDGDSYKGFPSDIRIDRPNRTAKLGILYDLILDFIGVRGLLTLCRNWEKVRRLCGYDVVQLINPAALSGFGSIANLIVLRYLKRNNGNIYLCALGDDYYWVRYCLDKKYKYSPLDGLNFRTLRHYLFSLKFVFGLFYKSLNNYAVRIASAIIPGLYDYKLCYAWSSKCTDVVPLPISEDKIIGEVCRAPKRKVVIFHGWQAGRELRKGNLLLDAAVRKLANTHPGKFEYLVVKSVPYAEYIKSFHESDVFLDQCYSYDRGMNGLLGMAAGKVVLSGGEPDAFAAYTCTSEQPAWLNAEPDVDRLHEELAKLVDNPDAISSISRAAVDFVRNNHTASDVAEKYVQIWKSGSSRTHAR